MRRCKNKMCKTNMKDKDDDEKTLNLNLNLNFKLKTLVGKRSGLYRKLWKIRDILPGAFSRREALCGKANCVCRREGKRHRVNQYSYKIGEKQVTKNILY